MNPAPSGIIIPLQNIGHLYENALPFIYIETKQKIMSYTYRYTYTINFYYPEGFPLNYTGTPFPHIGEAFQGPRLDVVHRQFDQGFSLDRPDLNGLYPIDHASKLGEIHLTINMLNRGSPLSKALYNAIYFGHLDLAAAIFENITEIQEGGNITESPYYLFKTVFPHNESLKAGFEKILSPGEKFRIDAQVARDVLEEQTALTGNNSSIKTPILAQSIIRGLRSSGLDFNVIISALEGAIDPQRNELVQRLHREEWVLIPPHSDHPARMVLAKEQYIILIDQTDNSVEILEHCMTPEQLIDLLLSSQEIDTANRALFVPTDGCQKLSQFLEENAPSMGNNSLFFSLMLSVYIMDYVNHNPLIGLEEGIEQVAERTLFSTRYAQLYSTILREGAIEFVSLYKNSPHYQEVIDIVKHIATMVTGPFKQFVHEWSTNLLAQ